MVTKWCSLSQNACILWEECWIATASNWSKWFQFGTAYVIMWSIKNSLEKFWSNQEVLLDYNADLHGIVLRALIFVILKLFLRYRGLRGLLPLSPCDVMIKCKRKNLTKQNRCWISYSQTSHLCWVEYTMFRELGAVGSSLVNVRYKHRLRCKIHSWKQSVDAMDSHSAFCDWLQHAHTSWQAATESLNS